MIKAIASFNDLTVSCLHRESFIGSTIMFVGRQFQAIIYPKGRTAKSKGKVSLYLLCPEIINAKINFDFTILNQRGLKEIWSSSGSCVSNEVNQLIGVTKAMKSKTLFDPNLGFCVSGRVLVRIQLTVSCFHFPVKTLTTRPRRKKTNELTSPSSSKTPTVEDTNSITVIAGKQSFHVNAEVLTRHSEVFQAMFSQPMAERLQRRIKITDFDAVTVKLLLDFMQADCLPSADIALHARELFRIAAKYAVARLVTLCENQLASSIVTSNAVDLLKLSDLHESIVLKAAVMTFLLSNIDTFLAQDGFGESLGGRLCQEVMGRLQEMRAQQTEQLAAQQEQLNRTKRMYSMMRADLRQSRRERTAAEADYIWPALSYHS